MLNFFGYLTNSSHHVGDKHELSIDKFSIFGYNSECKSPKHIFVNYIAIPANACACRVMMALDPRVCSRLVKGCHVGAHAACS